MAIEEEFNVEIPDKEADEIKSVGQAVDYIAQHPEGTYFYHYLSADACVGSDGEDRDHAVQ